MWILVTNYICNPWVQANAHTAFTKQCLYVFSFILFVLVVRDEAGGPDVQGILMILLGFVEF